MRFGREVLESDLYALLSVEHDASFAQIRARYRRLARESHPDIHPNDPAALRRMTRLNLAARVLLDPAQRRAYDQGRAARNNRAEGCWYERVSVGPSDWASPDAGRGGGARTQASEFRQRRERTALLVQDLLLTMSNERRLSIAALCLALGWGLISFAHPSNAFWLPAPGADRIGP
jgi:curved DNA-binding protein CbpA